MKSTIRLFRALPVNAHEEKELNVELLERTTKNGYIISPEVVFNHPDVDRLLSLIDGEVGLSGEQMNASFHKSWKKVKEASIEQLVIEQIIHYITTYGFESLGIYNEASVYIPNEVLEVPTLDSEGLHLIVIKGYTKTELKEKLLALLNTGIALKEKTMADIVDVAMFVEVTEDEVESVKNKETKIMLYDYMNIVPKNPTEFLRYIVFKATDNTLLIKNKTTIEKIKESKNLDVTGLFRRYKEQHGLERLATIFHRFKPLFLAFKTNTQLSRYINKTRKLAKTHHRPMPEDYLNSVTARIKDGTLGKVQLMTALGRANTFRKIRLAYALKYRTKPTESILYKIRNGKSYATEFSFPPRPITNAVYEVVRDAIVDDIRKNVGGKKIYIPENMVYALPATEKQFTGQFPSGSYVSVPRDMIFGVHWNNVDGHRIDLDLSLMNANVGKIGWDARYRTEQRNILFSGDVTDALERTRGASELFYVQSGTVGNYIMHVNYYNYDKDVEVPYSIVVAKEEPRRRFGDNYMVDPNNVVALAKSEINKRQKILGLVSITPDGGRFYFSEAYMGNSITSRSGKGSEHSRKYLFNFYTDTISLNEILERSGAELVLNRDECDIDLSPEVLEKDTIINLVRTSEQKASEE